MMGYIVRTYRKRIIIDVVSVGMLLLAVGLILLMHRYMGDVKSIYLPEEKTTGMPFNIGFRWSVILGMIGVILIQVVMYVWTYCSKSWKLFTWATGIWIYSAIVFEYVSSSSKLDIFFILRDDLQYSNPDIIYFVWTKINMLVYAILFVIGFIYLSKWLFGTNEKSSTTLKVRKFVPIIFIILGALILAVETYKNSWYLISCIVTSMVSWRLLGKLEKACEPYMDEEISDSLVVLIFGFLLDFFIEELSYKDPDE